MRYLSGLLTFLLVSSIMIAQENCPAFIAEIDYQINAVCSNIARNELCYVYDQLVIETDDNEVVFGNPGDTINIENVTSIQTSIDLNAEEYGVAILTVQANVPNSLPGQNVTFLLFGDTRLAQDGRDPLAGDDPYTPMQATYFSAGIGPPDCNDLPDSGMLIQTPDLEQPVELVVNGALISLGSTAYITFDDASMMLFSVVEGEGIITSDNQSVVVPEGSVSQIEVDEDGNVVGSPSNPVPYEIENLENLPLSDDLIIDPASEDTIVNANTFVGLFGGCWTSTDTDGSSQSMCMIPTGRDQFRLIARDEGGTVCGDTGEATEFAVILSGSGIVNEDGILDGTIAYRCLGGNNAAGEVPITYTPNSDDMIIDSFGVIWNGFCKVIGA